VRDERLKEQIRRVWDDRKKGRRVYGARKVWRQLRREGIEVARCTVERLMRELGMAGAAARRKKPRTTVPDAAGLRPADLLGRDFTAPAPNRRWVDGNGATLWTGAFRPGRQHDQTALKTEGTGDLLQRYPQVQALVDAGYRGLARQFPDQVTAPPLPPAKDAPPDETARWQTSRKAQSSRRICVEHANAEHKQWRTLQRYTGRRDYYEQTHLAIAGLVSDRAAHR
jgi:hypothetical protein